ncbi:unnamed protein product [Rhizoctonia solani]|uniref:CxC2-like cysteine cluster KDZ transposase-associated domain-containing protein n=1 Tax=Rhizoctonia solani TaxID=456999 RepID=A0A8H3DLS3_9AGAM|nr:unnamed protein product [Rhizoctonia solani]
MHKLLPTHRIQTWVWSRNIWADTSLDSFGYVLHLGHHGAPCSLASNTAPTKLLLGDLTGLFSVKVQFCLHDDAPAKSHQLLAAGLFPCSDINPRSAFTTSLLDMFNILVTLGRTSAHKFYSVIERISRPGLPDDVPDRYRELIATHRRFLHVRNRQRSGDGFEIHPTDCPGSYALDCPACPRPGHNFQSEEVSPEELEWFRSWLSYDGNFQSVRKDKKVEAGDICFSEGKAYVPEKKPYVEWTESQTEPQRTEKPICDHHKAGNDTSTRFVGRDVTGVGAITCAPHSCFVPGGFVDFRRGTGEKFIYADYALASSYAHMSRLGSLTVGLTYDVWCHYQSNLWRRNQNLPSSIALPPQLDLVGAIPKWHLAGHDQACYVRWSLDNTQHVGRMEGEGPERVWAHLNEHSGSTSEQGPGARTDTLNNVAYEWNFEKMIRMHHHLPGKFLEARRMYEQQKAVHDDLAESLPADQVSEWAVMPLTPVQGPDGRWSSPLMDPVWSDGRFKSIIDEESKKESSTARVPRRQLGAARWISDGIELEHSMRNLQDQVKGCGSSPTPRQAESINKARINLRDRIVQHNKRRTRFMTQLAEHELDSPASSSSTIGEPEHSDLGLPSSFTSSALITAGLTSMAELEKDLRRGLCDDALESVRHLLGARAFALNYKRRHIRGEVATTRAEAGLRAHSVKISKACWRYENSRSALERLGFSDSDFRRYQIITATDLRSLKSYLEDISRSVGQGYTAISWIWRSSTTTYIDDWQVNALRTEWFRSRERYKRWEEQLVLLKREMTMTLRTFRSREEIWKWKAESGTPTPGMRSYALKQSEFYGELARRALAVFQPHLYDRIVILQWSDTWLDNNANLAGFIPNSNP